tara:strand:+ start:1993 stop:2937 length:945 start_codon:yes stop_codon:yes gene_type:complete
MQQANNQKKINVLGDANVDMVLNLSKKDKLGDPELFSGGSSANVASGLARLGLKVSFFGSLGNDMYGKYVINEMNSEGIDTSNIELLDEFNTAMVIGVVEKSSERSLFVWPPKNGAHNKYILNNKSKKEILDCDWLHVSGISLRFSPVRETMIEAMKLCKEKNKIVSFDLNLRTELWGFDESFRDVVLEAVSYSSIIFGNLREELFYLFDENEDKLHKNLNDDQVLICRDGENGALGITVKTKVKSDSVPIIPFDSVGAGDAFNTGFIYTFSKGLGIEESLNNGNLVAAYKLLGSGARHLPNEQQLEEFKKEYL